MDADKLFRLIGNKTAPYDLVMIKLEGSPPLQINDLEVEEHDDGSRTAWILAEEI